MTDTVSLLESTQAGSVDQAPTYSLLPTGEDAAYTVSLNNSKSTHRTNSVIAVLAVLSRSYEISRPRCGLLHFTSYIQMNDIQNTWLMVLSFGVGGGFIIRLLCTFLK
jgi:hypothetical protein